MKYKKIIIVCLAIIMLFGSTFAFVLSSEKAVNIITSNTLSLALHDECEIGVPFPKEGITNILPGDTVNKYVYVRNDDNSPEWVRIRLEYDILPSPTTGATISLDNITLDINKNKWIEKDGWYYYKVPIWPEEYTDFLFTGVTFSYLLDNDYEDCNVKINVIAQSTQYANNGDSVLEAAGWPKGVM